MNLVMVGVPAVLIGLGWTFHLDTLVAGLLFTILTGFFQVIVGIGVFMDSGYKNKFFSIYIILTLLFFALKGLTDWKWVIALPPLLALYITVLLIIEAKKETNENTN